MNVMPSKNIIAILGALLHGRFVWIRLDALLLITAEIIPNVFIASTAPIALWRMNIQRGPRPRFWKRQRQEANEKGRTCSSVKKESPSWKASWRVTSTRNQSIELHDWARAMHQKGSLVESPSFQRVRKTIIIRQRFGNVCWRWHYADLGMLHAADGTSNVSCMHEEIASLLGYSITSVEKKAMECEDKKRYGKI